MSFGVLVVKTMIEGFYCCKITVF